jgi:hypothetical protein
MRFPISKALFNRHTPGIQIYDLLGGEGEGLGDQKIPGFLIPFAPKDNQGQRDLLPGMIENRIALDLARFDRKTSQGLWLSLVINEDILFGSDQKRDTFSKKLHQQGRPGIAAVHDEQRSTLHGKATHHRQNQSMLQDVLTLLNHPIGEAGKGDGKDSSFKDQSQEQGRNPSDGGLIKNQGPSLSYRLKTTDQSHMERNQGFGHESSIGQEPKETQRPSLGSDLQGQTAGDGGLRKPAVAPACSLKQGQQGMS